VIALNGISVRGERMRSHSILLLLSVAAVCFGGCQTGSVSAVVPLAGGGQMTVPMAKGGPPPAEHDGFRVERASFSPDKEAPQLRYEFALRALQPPSVSHIRVDDLSDETLVTLMDDPHPEFVDSRWTAHTDMIPATDPTLKWMFQITPSIRVFRFTITRTDGQKITLDQVCTYPAVVKQAIRHDWGEKY
jgi:hypothetical protein